MAAFLTGSRCDRRRRPRAPGYDPREMADGAVVDLSHFNAGPDFLRAKRAGLCAVVHKASQGIAFCDPLYAERRHAAESAGLLWGAYHFGTNDDGAAQADFFLKAAQGALPVLDFEENPAGESMTVDQARAFVQRIESVTGIRPGIYGGDYLREQLGVSADPVLGTCWLWWSQYDAQASIPGNWKAWTLWQYTDSAAIEGIGACDCSRFNGTAEELEKFWSGCEIS